MPQDPSRITYLLQRYTSKTCTRQELDELFACIAAAAHDEEIHQFLEAAYRELPAGTTLPEVDIDGVYANIIPPKKRIFPFRYAAAAAVILAVVALTLFWPRSKHSTTPNVLTQLKTTDIRPAANKAILTLPDGTTYTLDSAGNQQITKGVQQKNGQLEYHAQTDEIAIQLHTLSTPRGGQFHFTLPDGTKVWLNSSSSLRYPTAFAGKERIVELEGQGYFEVAQEAARPFKVKVNNMEVQVLGTHFDVMAYKDEATVNTTLVEGAVNVKEGNAQQLLKPGQQAILRQHVFKVEEADVRKVLAWKNGLFVFNNMDLRSILREVARWYDVDIVYSTTPSEELYGGGISRSLHLSSVLDLLEASGYNHFKIEGRKVIVLP